MKNITKKYILTLIFFCINSSFSQFVYREEFSVPMSILGVNIQNPWTGGHTGGQFYRLNLNGSGQEDLVVFDKHSSRIYTYIHNGTDFSYDPRYISYFPPITNWLTIIDYDCDGKKDIFTANSISGLTNYVSVYRNSSVSTTIPSWNLVVGSLPFEGVIQNQGLKIVVSNTETPSVTDIDDDGDIDIVVYDANSGSALNFYRNMSKETHNDCTHLEFEKYIACWGKFGVTANCGNLISPFTSCPNFNAKNSQRTEHNGSSVAVFDINGDGLKDVLLGDVSCVNLTAVTNSGTNLSAVMQMYTPNFPSQFPVTVPVMPIVSIEDLDGDNLKDMVVTADANHFAFNFDGTKSIQFYKNTGNTTLPSFQFQQNDFLQNQTLDLGYNLYPSLVDIDADGDLDIICGTPKKPQNNNLNFATLILIRNIGTKFLPKFNVENFDFLGLSSLNYQSIKPSFIDINNDNKIDIYFHIREASNVRSIKYILNQAEPNQPYLFPVGNIQTLPIIPLSELDTPILHDISGDGLVDILQIKANFGPLNYYKNTGTVDAPSFVLQRYILPPSTTPSALFGGMDFNQDFQNYSGTITKLKTTDTPVLLTSDANGQIRLYPNFINEQANFITKDTLTLLNTLDSLIYPFRLSAQSTFATGDLYGDSTTTFVIGESGGGLRMFVNKDSRPIQNIPTFLGINPAENSTKKLISIFPNPASESIFINAVAQDLHINFYNNLGVLAKKYNQKLYKSETEISISDLHSGIYFLIIRLDGHLYRHKLQKF